MPAQQPLAHRPGAARLLDGRLGFAWFLSQHWFQAEVRAGRVKRTLGGILYHLLQANV
jgi:hypothetical protein